jgi:phage-related minor tail protein
MELATAYVSLLPSLKGLKKQTTEGMKGVGDKAGKQYGEEFADGVTRGADGKLRDANGRYVKQSKETGEESGRQYSKGMTGTLMAGMAAGAIAVGAVLAKGIGDALEREKLGDKTAASLGLTEKQSAKAGSVAGKLYAGAWGENMPAVTDAVESVISSIDGMATATPKRLHDVTASVLDIATAFEIDASSAATNVGILIKNGLAKDAEEGVDLITASLQRVPKALRGEVTDATQEYSQFFADLGYSGSEAMGLLVSATEDGAYGVDKMGDAIKEFTIRGTDMSKSTKAAYETLKLNSLDTTNELLAGGDRAKRAFQTIVNGVKGIKDPAKQAETAIALFGTPLEDLGTNEIPKFLDGLTGTASSLGSVEGAAAKMGDTLNDNLATKIETIKRTVEVFVSGALMGMFTWLDKNRSMITLVAAVVAGAALGFGLYNAAIIATRLPLILATAAQWALNAALTANPIGLVVVAIGALVGALVWLYQNNETVRRVVDAVWAGIQTAIGAVVDWLVGTAWPWIQKVWNGIKVGLEVAWTVIRVIFATWATVFALLWQGISAVWAKTGAPVFRAIQAVATAVWNWLRDKVFTPVRLGFQLMALGMQVIKNRVIDPVWDGIKSAASAAWNWIRDKAFVPLKAGLDAMGEVFKATKKIISAAWDGIKAAAARPINFVIETVYTKGIKATWDKIAKSVGLDLVLPTVKPIAYKSGGVLPGYTPGRDVHEFFSPTAGRLSLSGGEAIMRPEFTRAVGGPAGVAALNSAARTGQAFADGGVWGWAGDIASHVGKFFSNPAGALGDLLSKPLESVLGRIGGGSIGKIAGQLPRKAVGALIEKAKSLLSTVLPSGGKAGPAMGWQAQWAAVKGMFPGANLHSAYRPGAVTAVGTPSFHGKGRAIDVSPSMAIFNWLARAFPNSSELIYSPAGGRQLYMGRQTMFGEPTRSDHYDHIHWAMKNGGVLPKLYDQGGWLPSGGLGVNQTGKPEAVLTPAESNALKDGLHRGPLVGTIVAADPRQAIYELEAMQRRAEVRAGVRGIR